MNNDIIPPPRPPVNPPQQPVASAPSIQPPVVQSEQEVPSTPMQAQPVVSLTSDEAVTPEQPPRKPYMKWVLMSLAAIVLLGAALIGWYLLSLRPVSADEAQRVTVTISNGSSPLEMGELLQSNKVIRSKAAFYIYTRLHGVRGILQAGTYSLSPAKSTPQIVGSLTSGEADQFNVTFYPGATLTIDATAADKTPSHRQVLQKLGYSDEEIAEAFSASYDAEYPLLFSGKPVTADLEGYVYGQTYRMASGSSVKQILRRTFEEFETQIKENNLVEVYKAQGLSLYQGITLASIIQREVPAAADQKQVAQVFLKRYRAGGTLGSDVTYHYAADKLGVPRDHELNSPYNTRKVAGLPPGPISSPGSSALLAVAFPAPGEYLYFISGDDDKTYFATTNEEHEANVAKHCAYKCSLP